MFLRLIFNLALLGVSGISLAWNDPVQLHITCKQLLLVLSGQVTSHVPKQGFYLDDLPNVPHLSKEKISQRLVTIMQARHPNLKVELKHLYQVWVDELNGGTSKLNVVFFDETTKTEDRGTFMVKGDLITQEPFRLIQERAHDKMIRDRKTYIFKNEKLSETMSVAVLLMQALPDPYVRLYRKMSEWEYSLWKKGDVQELRDSWNNSYRKAQKTFNGKMGSFWSIGAPLHHNTLGTYQIETVVPRSKLVEFAKEDGLEVGHLDDRLLEIHLPEESWYKLVPFISESP